MDNSDIILVLFILVGCMVLGGIIYYVNKARAIAASKNSHTNLMADVQKELSKKED